MIDEMAAVDMMNDIISTAKEAPAGWDITEQGLEIIQLLLDKNIAYGNSALNPIGIFSKTGANDQIDVRIDDKLNRLKNGKEYPGDDTILDLVGYLILKLVARKNAKA
jgi:hypothetical protein